MFGLLLLPLFLGVSLVGAGSAAFTGGELLRTFLASAAVCVTFGFILDRTYIALSDNPVEPRPRNA